MVDRVATGLSRDEWDDVARRLREPFDPKDVDFRVQGRVSDQTGKAQVVAYIDARAVQDRLDAVVGAGNWAFDWTPLVIDAGEVKIAKGTLTIYGVSKSDAGSASNFEQTLGAVSHCFKRAAVQWGIGRYLYNLPMSWVAVERNGRIPDGVMSELRGRLPRPAGSGANAAPRPATTSAEHTERAAQSSGSSDRAVERPTPVNRPAAQARPTPTPAAKPTTTGEAPRTQSEKTSEPSATEQQMASIRKLCTALGKPDPAADLTFAQAKQVIIQLSTEYQRARKAS